MKKLFALLLAAVMALSLVACGGNDTKTDEPSGDQAAEITSALSLLETVWNDYSDDEKFSVVGGGPDAEQMVDGASSEGKFKAKSGRIFLSDGLDYEVDPNVYGIYKVDGSTLTILDYVGEDQNFLGMYPLTFTKAG